MRFVRWVFFSLSYLKFLSASDFLKVKSARQFGYLEGKMQPTALVQFKCLKNPWHWERL